MSSPKFCLASLGTVVDHMLPLKTAVQHPWKSSLTRTLLLVLLMDPQVFYWSMVDNIFNFALKSGVFVLVTLDFRDEKSSSAALLYMTIWWQNTLRGRTPNFADDAAIFGFFSPGKTFILHRLMEHWTTGFSLILVCLALSSQANNRCKWMCLLQAILSAKVGSKLSELPWISSAWDFNWREGDERKPMKTSYESRWNFKSRNLILWSSYTVLIQVFKKSIFLYF